MNILSDRSDICKYADNDVGYEHATEIENQCDISIRDLYDIALNNKFYTVGK